nr:hypothetical protein [Brevundimonas diminuta]
MNNYEPMWAKYYAPKLSAREINQFRRAEMRGPSLLLTDIIQQQSFDPANRRYMAVANRKDVRGRNHFLRAELGDGRAEWELQCLFTNALQMSLPWDDDFRHPSNRVEIARHHILTIEFDSPSLPFFKQQLSWFRFEKKPTDSPIGKFVRYLRAKYADFAGLNVTYSGNKSFHYHFVVETSLIAGAVPEPSSARLGFEKAWDRLRDEFINSTDLMVPSTERPDRSLREPEMYRRLPNGMRLNDKEDHFFGVPVGDVLMQVVMWEHLTLQRSRGGSRTLLQPADFAMVAPTSATAPRTSGTHVQTTIQPGEEAYCAAKLEAIFNGVEAWPRFAGFDRSQGDLRAQFFNSPGDKNPTSMMRSDFATVLVQGANPLGLTNIEHSAGVLMPRLPRPLGEMMELWSEEHRQKQLGPGGRLRAPVEQRFADSATSRPAATNALGDVIYDLIPGKITRPGVDLLCAPEGISKSGTLLANLPRYHRLLSGHGLPSWMMFASPTYDGAEEKAQAFENAMKATDTDHFAAVALPSFSRVYEEEFGGRGTGYISHTEAARSGFSSRFDAIGKLQPRIMEGIRKRYAALQGSYEGRHPIFFTVHPVAQSWGSGPDSRLLLSPKFWNNPSERGSLRSRLLEDTRLGFLIHDEIDAKSIVDLHPAETVATVRALVADAGWTSKTTKATKFQDHERFRRQFPSSQAVSFEEACRIAAVEETEWDVIAARPAGEYGPRSNGFEKIYDQADERHWCLRARNWANIAAHKTLILTTEAVPVALAERAGLWDITALDTPLIEKDRVETHPLRALRSSTAAEHVADWTAEAEAVGCEPFAIGNKLDALENSRSHIAAKGSNELIGKDIIQTMTLMTPDEYARYQALNAWTGRDDLARLKHIDDINQSAGRNLGFRAPQTGPRPSHTLLINRRLFDCLVPLFSHLRYDLVDATAAQSRKNARKRGQKVLHPPMTSGSSQLQQIRTALNNIAA